MSTFAPPSRNRALYDQDLTAWAQWQVDLLRARAWDELDVPHLIEALDGVGRSDVRAAQSYLALVFEHLLKLTVSPARPPRVEWRQSVIRHRLALLDLISDTPSLRGRLDLEKAYLLAARTAVAGLADHDGSAVAARVPSVCPYTMDQALDTGWWPDSP